MESEESLPIILVSAADVLTADEFISELIGDEEVPPAGERASVEAGAGAGAGARRLRVWQLRNKYYSARVALLARGEPGAPAPPALLPRLDAHLVLLASHETEMAACVERHVAGAGGAGGAGGAAARVRLALAQCAGERGAWAAAARALGYEPVPLLEEEEEADSDSEAAAAAGPRGMQRAREALHAHTWSSLRLHADTRAPPPGSSSESGCSDEEPGEGEEAEEWSEWHSAELTRRRADQFAAALGALAGARGGGGAGAARGEARLLRAEALLAALAPRDPPPRPRPAPPP